MACAYCGGAVAWWDGDTGEAETAFQFSRDHIYNIPVYTHPPAAVPEWIYDGYAVYSCLSDKAKTRTSTDNVSDTLDAIKVMLKKPTDTGGE